ncbi:MAG: tetratricopeptide repeat protein [Flavobacteriaceae bacterium]|nr:tetratricopeptide repeat protein [Flavobacteriaceae bacterium]
MKHYFLKNIATVLVIFLSHSILYAQQSEANIDVKSTYSHALKLYNNKAYAAAQKLFKQVALQDNTLKSDADYYTAITAVKLNQPNADKLVLKFVEENPSSNKKEKAFLNVGNYYFSNRNPGNALKWYAKIHPTNLSFENKNELNFKMGYALLVAGNLKLAKNKFYSLINTTKYGSEAKYYYGYIAYKQKDYTTAQSYLTNLGNSDTYNEKVDYYLLDMSFKNGEFEKCITFGKKLLENKLHDERSEISKIIGESYFNLQKYKEAIPYLRAYKGKRGKWNNTDYYQLGYAFYKQNDFENAAATFNKIIGANNSISQNAYYHLAECYLYIDKKSEALNAFKNASEMDFNKKIKEDAFYNYAKLSYELGNPYKSVAEVLQDFLKNYPTSPHYKEMNELVVTSYIYQQDYKGALEYLSKKKSSNNIELAKDVSYYRAIQLFNQKKLTEAYPFFTSATKSSDVTIKIAAMYWKAETDFQLSNFKKSLDGFQQFKRTQNASKIEEYKNVDYNIAYSYFKLKDYSRAANSFSNFIRKAASTHPFLDDARIRLADCYFVTKQYTNAIKAYNKIITKAGIGSDYATYQKAISYGFLGDNTQKINNLTILVNKYEFTGLKDDALFQLANTYVAVKNNIKAHEVYNELINKHTKSLYIPKALLRQGLVYYNDNDYNKALEKFKKIVATYPNSSEAKQAVTNAKNVYVDLGQVDVYAAWVKNISFVNVTNADLDNTTYEAAENKFLENNTEKAIDGFTKYINAFPNGLHALKANFYLAQSLLKTNQEEKATQYYRYVIEQTQSEFSEEALNKLALIYLKKADWNNATPLLIRLEQEANYPQNITFAQSNLMKGYYQANDYKRAVTYAEKVLQKEKIDETVEFDAKIIIARAAFKTGNLKKAETYYKEVENKASGELKAEALYYNSFFKNKKKDYKGSNTVIQKLIADYASYKYWGVRSYIIMAKNYYGLKDSYQAIYILENIIKNFKQFDDVITEAKKELDLIKKNEAKTNESVTPNNNKRD